MKVSGFYAVLDRDDENLARMLVGPGGARFLQVRVKPAGASEVLRIAAMARRVCDEFGAMLIVNDRIDIAVASRADGVHLGQQDVPLLEARTYRRDWIIGVSTHNVVQVEAAVAGGADYLGFGPIFATPTKKNHEPEQGLSGLRRAVGAAGSTPIVAIGGIRPEHVPSIYRAGASAICAISAVNRAPDAVSAARAMGLELR